MSTYQVNLSSMQAHIEALAAMNRTLKGMIQSLEEETRATLSTWTSDTQQAYQESKAKWDAAAERMPVALDNAGRALNEIMNVYSGTERAGANIFGR